MNHVAEGEEYPVLPPEQPVEPPLSPTPDPEEAQHVFGMKVGTAHMDIWTKAGEVHLALDRPGVAGIKVILEDEDWDRANQAVVDERG